MELEITPSIAAEAIAILENTEIALLAKIPLKLITFLQSKADEGNKKFKLDFNKSYEEQTLSQETRAVMTLIYREYWCSPEERITLDATLDAKELQEEQELREKYNPDKIFAKQNSYIPKIKNELAIIEEPKWYVKIINKIKNLFNKAES